MLVTTMTDAEEIHYDNDCLVITIDLVDCPMAEIPLMEVFDVLTMTLVENYHDVIRETVLQQLEDTTWLSDDLLSTLTDPGFGMYHARDRNYVISLRKPALQRLILQCLRDRPRPSDILHVPILIRFLLPDCAIPKPSGSSVASESVHASRSQRSHRSPPSIIDHPDPVDTTVAMTSPGTEENIPAFRAASVAAIVEPVSAAAATTFRRQPVNTRPTGGHGPPIVVGHSKTSLFKPATTDVSRTQQENVDVSTATQATSTTTDFDSPSSTTWDRRFAVIMIHAGPDVLIPQEDRLDYPGIACNYSPREVSLLLHGLRYQPIDRGR